MKRLLLAVFIVVVFGNIFPQTWQPIGVPEGSGVTDMVYWKGSSPFDDKLWVTAGSVDWPNGQRGGVFYSATTPPYQGVWYRLGGSAGYYVGRTLAVGQDGNLYASLWRDPAFQPADALCRFVPQAATFGVLYQAQAGDNIFSIAVKNTPHAIFAGTRNGIIRSTDNGVTFGYSNTGVPDSAWVYDIAIDSSGILAIASSKGVYISTDNGDTWQSTSGIAQGDTVIKILFDYNFNSDGSSSALLSGSVDGHLYVSTEDQLYLNFAIVYTFIDLEGHMSDLLRCWLQGLNKKLHGVAVFPREFNDNVFNTESGIYLSSDNALTWIQENSGLPPNPPVSALAVKVINETYAELYAGLFNDTTNGAGIYKLAVTVDVEEIGNQIPSEYKLEQNYPNPFNPSTTIQFALPKESFAKLEIFNSLGERVSTLVSETLSSGTYEYEWNAVGLTSGVYFYRLITNHFSEMKKMILLR